MRFGDFKAEIQFRDLEMYEDDEKYMGECWYELTAFNNPKAYVQIVQEEAGHDDWWNVRVSGSYLVDSNLDPMSFETPEDAFDELMEECAMIANGEMTVGEAFPYNSDRDYDRIVEMIDYLLTGNKLR